MRLPRKKPIALAVLLTCLAGCSSTPAPCFVAPVAVERPPLPAEVMDRPVPDYSAWLERVLSSSMARLFPTSPTSPSPQPTPAAP